MRKPVKWSDPSRSSHHRDTAAAPQSLQDWGGQVQVRAATEDDLLVIPTDRQKPGFSLSGFLVLVGTFFLFKAGAILWLGPQAYQSALVQLQAGTVFDRIAAFIMNQDALSVLLATQFQGLLP